MLEKLLAKLNQRELWVTVLGMLAPVLATKLGVAPEILKEALLANAALAGAYAVSRGMAKHGKPNP